MGNNNAVHLGGIQFHNPGAVRSAADRGHNLVGALRLARLAGCLSLFAAVASAQQINETSAILRLYSSLSAVWYVQLIGPATNIFWILTGIEFTYFAITLAFGSLDLRHIAGKVVIKVIAIGFWFWALTHAGSIMPAIINGIEQMGVQASGFSSKLAPSDILSVGYQLANILGKAAADAGWFGIAVTPSSQSLTIATWLVMLSFSFIAFLSMTYSVYGYLLVAAGSFGLMFGATRWTSQYAARYFAMAIEVGVRLFTLQLLVGAGMFLTAQWAGIAQTVAASSTPMLGSADIAISALMFAGIVWSVPRFMASLVQGNVHMTGSEVLAMTSVMAGAAISSIRMTMAGGSALSAGATPVAAAASVGGGSSSNGSGSGVGAMAGVSGGGSNGTNGSGRQPSPPARSRP